MAQVATARPPADDARRPLGAALSHVWAGRAVMLAAVVMTALPLALTKAANVVLPVGVDQGLYATIGEMINQGGVPWRDAWENKPPGTYYLYAAVLALTPEYAQPCVFTGSPFPEQGFRPPCAQIALSLFDWLYALTTAAVVWWIGRRLFGWAAGALASVLFGIFASLAPLEYGGGMPDLYLLLPSTLAYAAGLRYADTRRRRWLALAGVLAAMAALFKQTGMLTLVALAAWRLAYVPHAAPRGPAFKTWLGDCRLLALGAGGVFGITSALIWLQGALPDLLDQTILWYRFYLGTGSTQDGFLYRAVVGTWHVFSQSQAGLWLAALGAIPLLSTTIRRDRRHWLLVSWAVAAGASVAMGGARFAPYYYAALVPIGALLASGALTYLWGQAGPLWRLWLLAATVGLLLLSVQFHAHVVLLRAWNNRVTSATSTTEERIVGLMRSGPPGPLFLWGNASQVYALSGRPPASRFLHSAAISDHFARLAPAYLRQNRAALMASLEAQRPVYIALDGPFILERQPSDFPELRALLSQGYELVTDSANPVFRGWQLYRRKDL